MRSRRRRLALLVVVAFCAAGSGSERTRAAHLDSALVSISAVGGNGFSDADLEGISTDGTRAWFQTDEALAAGDNDGGEQDVYEWHQGAVTLVSTGGFAGAGTGAATATFRGASADGLRVFFSTTEKLEAADGEVDQVDVYERSAGATTLISTGGAPGAGTGANFAVFGGASADGTRVFFETAEKLENNDADAAKTDVYQRSTGLTTLVSTGSFAGAGSAAETAAFEGASADGTRVFFTTDENLEPGDGDTSTKDVYQWSAGATALVSTGSIGGVANTSATFGGASADGSRVFFNTQEPMEPGDADAATDVYERAGGVTTLLTTGAAGGAGAHNALFAGATPDGSFVFFLTDEKLENTDTDSNVSDLYQRSGGVTTQVSRGTLAGAGATASFQFVSTDGSRVVFNTSETLEATDGDTSQNDLYLRSGGVTTQVSTGSAPGAGTGGFGVAFLDAADDGSTIFFFTSNVLESTDGDTNQADIYEWSGGVTRLVSTGNRPGAATGSGSAEAGTVTPDGRRFFFDSTAQLDNADSEGAKDVYLADTAPEAGFASGATTTNERSATPGGAVQLSEIVAAPVTVDYAVTGGTATAGSDFTLGGSGTITFDPFETSANVPLTVLQDSVAEGAETIILTLSGVTNGTLGTATHTVTIVDDDPRFSVGSSSLSEKAGTRTVRVVLPDTAPSTVTVGYRAGGGTAKNGQDFVLTAGTLTFAAGDTAQTISFSVKQDFLVESAETVIAILHPVGQQGVVMSQHTLAIIDDEPKLKCGGKNATIVGSPKADSLTGTNGADVIHGRGGDDGILGLKGNDVLCGIVGNDTLDGGDGADKVFGGGGDDLLRGGKGNDVTAGAAGSDVLVGGPGGNDRCLGGAGADALGPNAGCEVVKGVP